MVSIRTIRRVGLGLLCAAALPVSLGCQTTKRLSLEAYETVLPPEPATNIGCMWKKEIAHLNDPTKNGVKSPGIVGMMNLYAASGMPTKAAGDLQIMAYDETPRPAGQAAGMAEMWHFDPVTLKRKLATRDERGMDCYALFLPWPKNWTDVTKVRIQAKYVPKDGGTELSASDQVMVFEFPNQSATTSGAKNNGNAQAKAGPSDIRGIPNLKTILNQQQPLTNKDKDVVVAAKAVAPPTAQPIIIPASSQMQVAPQAPMAPIAPVQLPANAPVVISQEAAPMPMPTPPPPPSMPTPVGATPMLPVIPGAVRNTDTVIVPVGEGLPALEIPAAR